MRQPDSAGSALPKANVGRASAEPGSATVLVTGATDGLGRWLARELAAGGAQVLVHGRDEGRIRDTLREVEQRTPVGREEGREHCGYRADLASLAEVRRLAEEVSVAHPRLDVLVNNAGIGSAPRGDRQRRLSTDGYELHMAVNYLAAVLLTERLLPRLRAGAPARIVNVASAGQAPVDFGDPMLERQYDGVRAYCQSKLALIMFTFDLAERLSPAEVAANALHPSTYMPTKMVLESVGRAVDSLERGGRATLRLIADPALEGVSGRYYDREREASADDQAYDPAARARLRRLTAELLGSA